MRAYHELRNAPHVQGKVFNRLAQHRPVFSVRLLTALDFLVKDPSHNNKHSLKSAPINDSGPRRLVAAAGLLSLPIWPCRLDRCAYLLLAPHSHLICCRGCRPFRSNQGREPILLTLTRPFPALFRPALIRGSPDESSTFACMFRWGAVNHCFGMFPQACFTSQETIRIAKTVCGYPAVWPLGRPSVPCPQGATSQSNP